MTLNELKARAFDLMRQIESCQREIIAINKEIEKIEHEEMKKLTQTNGHTPIEA